MDSTKCGVCYGPQLIADLDGCEPAKMSDGVFVYTFLQRLVGSVGMQPIGSPHLDLYTGPHEAWKGWSATVHIQTSHVTAHFFAFGYVFLDVFSCQPFDVAKTQQFIIDALKPSRSAQFRLVDRGHNFPLALVDPAQLALASASLGERDR